MELVRLFKQHGGNIYALYYTNQHLMPITQHQAGTLVYYTATSQNFELHSFKTNVQLNT